MKTPPTKYCFVSEEGFIAWLDETGAESAGGYGINVMMVTHLGQQDEFGNSDDEYLIEAMVWYGPRGKFALRVNMTDLNTAILAAAVAMDKIGEVQ